MALSLVVLLVVGFVYGPNVAVGVTVVLSFSYPRWIRGDWIDPNLDLIVGTGLLAIGYYCIDRRSTFRTNLVYVDFLFLAFVATGLVSDFSNEGIELWTILVTYCEWILPYLLGRAVFQKSTDVIWLVFSASLCASFISLCCMIETVFHINPFEWLLEERTSALPKYLFRFGWQRAFGPTENPIYLGTLLLLMMPWTIRIVESMIYRRSSYWVLIALIMHVLGILSSVSRAPILAIGILPLVACFLRFRSMRIPALFVVIFLFLIYFFNWNSTLQDLRTLGGENVQAPSPKIMLDGEMVNYSSTEHRLQLWRLYRTAIERAGLLGYGSDRTSVFPPNVPMGGEHNLAALKSLWCIDNQYLLITLRFGFLGLALWILLLAASFWGFAFIASNESNENRTLFAFLAAAIVAVAIIQLTVWMPHDYGFVLMWTIGLSAGVVSTSTSENGLVHYAHYR